MTLYDMLDRTMYHQPVWIFESNAYDQNMPKFKGTVDEARSDEEIWDYLMCEVEMYSCEHGILDIRVRDEHYNERLEGHYSGSAYRWGREKEKRPWRYSAEIDMEKEATS